MKITEEQENELDGLLETNHPDELCPFCNRWRVYTYTGGLKVCGKCDEIVEFPTGQQGLHRLQSGDKITIAGLKFRPEGGYCVPDCAPGEETRLVIIGEI